MYRLRGAIFRLPRRIVVCRFQNPIDSAALADVQGSPGVVVFEQAIDVFFERLDSAFDESHLDHCVQVETFTRPHLKGKQ